MVEEAGLTRPVVEAPSPERAPDGTFESDGDLEMAVRVLIVDDQEPFRLAARAVVEATEGFEVAGEADTGEAALDAARRLHPDLVLMDVNLPGIDGLEATRRILDASPEAVVLLLSTYAEEGYAPRAEECGAAAYIAKSAFGPERLAEVWAHATPG